MKTQENAIKLSTNTLLKATSIGAIIPILYLCFIILTKEETFEMWMLYPLIIIPIGGGLGAIFFYNMTFIWFREGVKRMFAFLLSAIVYGVMLWGFAVLAFAITGHWN
ncbi:hypothetical protein ACFOUP_17065 [Belliella kenyensis]|uniref:Potassium transporter KefB n=1 Tax=Belliella kenyensis TaxID=1472724 RepID=A0ABV8ESJ0_9BACT|nr:hypothetical protein [Belliella kenyensis]MCH7402839.1 hypothetical protein [Belliella kenyensis]MDN3602545.1 hypothetical protein [Belliella kenyensis]